MKFRHDLAEKKFVPGGGWGWVGSGRVFSKFKECSKPFNYSSVCRNFPTSSHSSIHRNTGRKKVNTAFYEIVYEYLSDVGYGRVGWWGMGWSTGMLIMLTRGGVGSPKFCKIC